MPSEERHRAHLRKPSLDDFVFEGESVPLLLQRRVVFGLAAGFAALVVVYVVVSEALGISYDIDAEPFQEWVDGWGIAGPIVYMAALAVSVLIAPIPNAPIFIAAGLAWGPLLGTAYSMAGMMAGSAAAFYLSRWLGRRHLSRLVGRKMAARMDDVAATMGGRVIFLARMLPVVNFDWVSFVAGLTSIRFAVFFIFSFMGMLLPTFVGVAAGDGLGRDIRITLAYGGLWVAGVVASAAFFWYRQRRWQARRRAETASAEPAQGMRDV
ncbi:MAG: TVP38/TMEM64 family protein [Chloroflexi bacterium CFX7]|nr:MAG: TVP38/TMEM64 family protein [bacterium]MCE7927429.1 TVP38/TMEM64 family protein [Chloroflexi bacterium CFX7]MCL4231280.1 VTT domain-containing protein [Dehalococcoidia bacterium]RIL02120.1 MAG: hypothetical protein DCC78_08610 [bacterium]